MSDVPTAYYQFCSVVRKVLPTLSFQSNFPEQINNASVMTEQSEYMHSKPEAGTVQGWRYHIASADVAAGVRTPLIMVGDGGAIASAVVVA